MIQNFQLTRVFTKYRQKSNYALVTLLQRRHEFLADGEWSSAQLQSLWNLLFEIKTNHKAN